MPSAEIEVRDNVVTKVTLPTIHASKASNFRPVPGSDYYHQPGAHTGVRFWANVTEALSSIPSLLISKQVCVKSTSPPSLLPLFLHLASEPHLYTFFFFAFRPSTRYNLSLAPHYSLARCLRALIVNA